MTAVLNRLWNRLVRRRRTAVTGGPEPGLWFRIEKVAGKGEDATPFVGLVPGGGTVAVCDGLGGAGAALVPQEGRRQAAIAADLAVGVVAEAWRHGGPEPDPQQLADLLTTRFAERYRALELGHSRIRSKLLKALPTTLALGWFRLDGTTLHCGAVWAGDSRVHLLTAEHGLQQLSTDDLVSGGDARTNLHDDSRLSNLVSAEAPVTLGTRTVRHPGTPRAAAVIAATDGCFGYLPTPTHFEYVLLNELAAARDFADWIARVEAAVAAVTGDDASLAVAVVLPQEFTAFRRALSVRHQAVARQIGELTRLATAHTELAARAEEARTAYASFEAALWASYRGGYEGMWVHPRTDVAARLTAPGPGAP